MPTNQNTEARMAGIIRQTVIDVLPKAWRILPNGKYAADLITAATMLRIKHAEQLAARPSNDLLGVRPVADDPMEDR
ncbi:hypothetical protein AAGW05_06135 [Arthrobacter sp. LAPM80]|uniref:hypothetical protein n=1 Tax=Arthrobacter sp. LAPM80 TaxID=3141788 RepID=UPI00398B6A6B